MDFKRNEELIWLEDETGKTVAHVEFPEAGPGVVNVAHTVVDPSMGGRGIAGQLMEELVKDLRETGRKAELTCSYAVRWFGQHEECQDVLVKK